MAYFYKDIDESNYKSKIIIVYKFIIQILFLKTFDDQLLIYTL